METVVNILIIDNHDSFVYNLVELLREASQACRIKVVSSGSVPLEDLYKYDGLLLSPGPGLPSDYPDMMEALASADGRMPVLGICLGHQAIALRHGAELRQLERPLHGHTSSIIVTQEDPLLLGLPIGASIARYHSWVVAPESMPEQLVPLAYADGEIMALRHRTHPTWGLQFHPESMISTAGQTYIDNWLAVVLQHRNTK